MLHGTIFTEYNFPVVVVLLMQLGWWAAAVVGDKVAARVGKYWRRSGDRIFK